MLGRFQLGIDFDFLLDTMHREAALQLIRARRPRLLSFHGFDGGHVKSGGGKTRDIENVRTANAAVMITMKRQRIVCVVISDSNRVS